MDSYWLCPLYNFKSYSKNVYFDKGFQIKISLPELKNEFPTYYPDWFSAESFDYMIVMPQSEKFALETDIFNKIEELKKIHRELYHFITALRLCHDGEIIPGPLISAQPNSLHNNKTYIFDTHGWQNMPTDFGYLYGLIDLSKFEVDKEFFTRAAYRLRKSDVSFINENIRRISDSLEKYLTLNEILRRFNSSYYSNTEDRLVDQMIAFESLYLGDDKELGYKLSLRTAFLLTTDKDKRKTIFSDMNKAYGLRGKIMHGNKKSELSELENIISLTEEYLRQSIKRVLELLSINYSLDNLKKGKDKRLAKFDENILNNGKLLI